MAAARKALQAAEEAAKADKEKLDHCERELQAAFLKHSETVKPAATQDPETCQPPAPPPDLDEQRKTRWNEASTQFSAMFACMQQLAREQREETLAATPTVLTETEEEAAKRRRIDEPTGC